jgi:hypothetical protein
MDKKPPKKKENDSSLKEREVFLEKLDAQAEHRIRNWADLYTGLKQQIHTYIDSPSKEAADFTITLLHCFVLALEDLPDEGDAQVIYKHINKLLIMGEERTGAYLLVGAEAEEERRLRDASAAAEVALGQASVPTRVLH